MNLKDVQSIIGGELLGDPSTTFSDVRSLKEATADDLSFVLEPKYVSEAETSRAKVFVTCQQLPGSASQVVVKHPRKALQLLLAHWQKIKSQPIKWAISSQASIEDAVVFEDQSCVFVGPFVTISANCHIGRGVVLHGNSYIGEGCCIGNNTIIYPNVTLYPRTQIGANVIVHAGTTIGSDGFGYIPNSEKQWDKIPHIGRVVIEDDVEIGANCSIDKGCLGDTLIKKGTKLDNLVHVAHNVEIGQHSAFAAQTGLTGGVVVGDFVQVGGKAGIDADKVGNHVIIAGAAMVTKSIADHQVVAGFPAQNLKDDMKEKAILKRMVKHYSKDRG